MDAGVSATSGSGVIGSRESDTDADLPSEQGVEDEEEREREQVEGDPQAEEAENCAHRGCFSAASSIRKPAA
jgi:hypothetical protein